MRGLLGRHGIRSRLLWWDAEAEGCDWSACVFSGGGFKRGLTLTFPGSAAGERRAWAMQAALESEEGKAAIADVPNYATGRIVVLH